MAVSAEHSTDEGGEPRPKGLIRGKACRYALPNPLEDYQIYQKKVVSLLRRRLQFIQNSVSKSGRIPEKDMLTTNVG
ncbi:MAG: hypothetical protein GTO12_24575 [Proteobacteria bacterium]|nr:hypothetical protein [Pseudomonadota bacterium]